LNTTKDYKKIYTLGKVIRVAVNKLGRLCTKAKVIEACLDDLETDKRAQISSLSQQLSTSLKAMSLSLG
jgi:hypothetical protein